MAIRTDTLRRKLESKRQFLLDKIAPFHEELEMVTTMLSQMDAYQEKVAQEAHEKLGLPVIKEGVQ